ncbi:hypothetical protein H112_05390 [Trichophyton rubrum D6]|uniref:H/ACA ribonucleoprotein complex non-core subunit NAF1 n=3 Tax=Trichophyton rubrum TaxID=5551 RepID=A0A178EQC9_TRIRU|nr:uncharacterized protein TERG_03133 [Trichophyton rubrum CBS 118892]EZF18017.1 hypothetical protein H100_05410 [Trichophyton rubrum MR850]EZF40677.1 hypothetical protein H102_05375 [Trichophyton rubrum CBS 100081]EZF51322.1 hypothetical protein H103_05402 [Trichophyton rubrum CBS 288.86]EZF61897.1 hypothetical protein H104_05390 [Trichophyton rubrum CBS 289.86]EZF83217.1 hypothetical protein H110_05397 [Trichophyton rubrum MR1448]EZF93919.1 hypothetical protein H113_05443 [Trichophyton rubr
MEDTTMGDDTHTGSLPTEQPRMDNNSVAANGTTSTVATDTPKDEGSDFYNTPLNVGSSLQPGNAVPSNETITTEGSGRPRIMIPGLTLLSEEDHRNNSNQLLESVSKPSPNTVEQVPDTANRVDVVMSGDGIEVSNEKITESVGNPHARERADAAPDASLSAEAEIAALAAEIIEGIPPATEGEEQPGGGDHPEWEVDSSPYESSSESSTDSDSSDSDEDDDDDYELLDPEEQARLLMAAEGGSDDEGGDSGRAVITEVRTANEKPDEIVPLPDITITPEMKVEMLGNVESIVDNVVLVRANISGEYQVLETGSVLCSVNLKVIGVVSETLGRVQQPLYTVRFPNAEAVKEAGLEKETPVFYVVDHSTFVFTQPLRGLKGSDASNLHDEEVGDDQIEFSDDEAEAEYKRQLKLKRQGKREGKLERGGGNRGKGPSHPPSNLRHSELNYDDNGTSNDNNAEHGWYRRLARPQDLHEMMGGEAPMEMPHTPDKYGERPFRGGRGRGRGKSHDRGSRGGRGGRGDRMR